MSPAGVIRPTLFPPLSVNQRLPSGPAAMLLGFLEVVGMGYLARERNLGWTRTMFPWASVSQRLPSGPVARLVAGYSRTELGERVGVSAASVKAWETGARAPRASTQARLAQVLVQCSVFGIARTPNSRDDH